MSLKDFNGINLLTVSKSADYKKYARTIMKLLFSTDELANSILISNPIYARRGLDPNRMATWAGTSTTPFLFLYAWTSRLFLFLYFIDRDDYFFFIFFYMLGHIQFSFSILMIEMTISSSSFFIFLAIYSLVSLF